jgi:hypothetical protein
MNPMLPREQPNGDPSCFVKALNLEWWRSRNKHMTYLFRYHLSRYPKDLLREWWDRDRCLPWVTSKLAFQAYKAGEKPGHLYKGPPHRPKLKVVEGGKH